MKTKLYFFFTLCAIALLSACQKSETFDDSWKLNNEKQFAQITADAAYTKITSKSGNGFIMYKELKKGTGTKSPYFTDQVKVLYTGWYKNDWSKEDKYTDKDGNVITNKIIFDSTDNKNNQPQTFDIRRLIDGYRTALQYMHVGDKWQIWIPWTLAYGAGGESDIRGYTTLVFDVELVEIL